MRSSARVVSYTVTCVTVVAVLGVWVATTVPAVPVVPIIAVGSAIVVGEDQGP